VGKTFMDEINPDCLEGWSAGKFLEYSYSAAKL